MAYPRLAGSSLSGIATTIAGSQANQQVWFALAGGVIICTAIACMAREASAFAPLIGAPIFAILIGALVANTPNGQAINTGLRIQKVSTWALRGGIVLLGANWT